MTDQDKITYPPGVRDLTEDISTDDLVRRLKECAQAFQNMSQDDDNSPYIPLALLLASEQFIEHRSRDIQLLVACCIADVFRVYAPEAPYKDVAQLKVIFEFFVDQLKGLSDPQNPSFKRYFYLLENLSCVKTFNICFEFEDNQNIICRLYKLMFKIVNDNHSMRVKNFIVDMLSPLISEADLVSQELIDIILSQTIEPSKSQHEIACILAQDILKRTSTTLEPYIQAFFNNALILGRSTEGNISSHLYELIYELNAISPSMMVVVVPQLEFKLKSNDEKERWEVTKLVARMFSDKRSDMIDQNKALWACFLQRFHDISSQIRILCAQYSKQFLINHPESKEDIAEQLKQRHRDADEEVRFNVIESILFAAKEDFSSINEDMLSFVKERILDKKFRIRKETLLGLGRLHKQHAGLGSTLSPSQLNMISWIKNKILHIYYQTSIEDRLLVERILHVSLVPYQSPVEERMKLLYRLFCSVDEHAVKAFKEILKCQNILRSQVRTTLEMIQREKSQNRQRNIVNKVSMIARSLPDPVKAKQFVTKFCSEVEANIKLRSMMSVILNGNITCAEAANKVKEILKTLGNASHANTYYWTIKQLLERIAPVMVDKEGIKYLVSFIKDSLLGNASVEAELGLQNSANKGLELLLVLSYTFPHNFRDEDIYDNLMLFLEVDAESIPDITLQIFINVSNDLEVNYPDVCSRLLHVLENFTETGTSKQAKHAVYCINNIVSDKQQVFGKIIEKLKKHFTLESQYFRTALVSMGHIAYLCHNMFAADMKTVVSSIVVKQLLMLDQDLPRGGNEAWGPFEALPDETKCKIEGMKVMVRWLLGLKDMVQPAMSTLTLLLAVIRHGGDLMEQHHSAPLENSWMRLSAANCMLKLCQEPKYVAVLPLETFHVLAYTINDECPQVCDRFAQKVNKGLLYMKLPLEFLAVFCLGGLDSRKQFHEQVKSYLRANINKRRAHLKERSVSNEDLPLHLPDYSLAYAVHLLAHAETFKSYNDVPSLRKIKECLKLILDALMSKNENYSFPFFKRLLENIKQTKDRLSPDDEEANFKVYAVCDLALNIVLSRPNHVLKEFPAEPILNTKFFTSPDKSYSNMKTYLPVELLNPTKSGFEVEIFDSTRNTTSNTTHGHQNYTEAETTLESTKNIPSDTIPEQQEPSDTEKTFDSTTNLSSNTLVHELSDTEVTLCNKSQHKKIKPNCKIENSDIDSSIIASSSKIPNNDLENISIDSDVINSKDGSSNKSVNAIRRTRGRPPLRKKSPLSLPSKPSSKNDSVAVTSPLDISTRQQNGTSSSSPGGTSISSSLSDFQHVIKECNVRLLKDEVETYAAQCLTNSSDQDDSMKRTCDEDSNQSSSQNSVSSANASKKRTRSRSDLETKPATSVSKRKRDISPPSHSSRATTHSISISSSSESHEKSPLNNGRPTRDAKSHQKSKIPSNLPMSPEKSLKIGKPTKDIKPQQNSKIPLNLPVSPAKSPLKNGRFTRDTKVQQKLKIPSNLPVSPVKSPLKNGRITRDTKSQQKLKTSSNHSVSSEKSPLKNGRPTKSQQKSKIPSNHSVSPKKMNNSVKDTRETRRKNEQNEVKTEKNKLSSNSKTKRKAEVKVTGKRR